MNRLILILLIILSISIIGAYSTYGAPSEFGNETTTTCYLGGDDGIVNCTGNISTDSYFIGNGSQLVVNSSDYWDDYNIANSTWFENVASVLSLKLTQLETWIDGWLSGKTTDNLTQGSTNLYANQTLNNELYWNETENIDATGYNITGDYFTINSPATSCESVGTNCFTVQVNGSIQTCICFSNTYGFINWSQAVNGTLAINSTTNNYIIDNNDSVNNYIVDVNTTQSSWVDNLFVRFTEIVSQVGNWSLDSANYYNTTQVDDINTSMENYVDVQNGSVVNYIGVVNTSVNNYILDNNNSVTNSITSNNASVTNALENRYTKAEADLINTSNNNYIAEVNLSMNNSIYLKSEVDAQNTSQTNYINFQNTSATNFITANNDSMNYYISSQNLTWFTTWNATTNATLSNAIIDAGFNSTTNDSITNSITANNASMGNYVDSQDVIYNNSIAAYVNTEDARFNNSIASYVDSQDLVFNTTMVNYVGIQNGSVVNWISNTFNTTRNNYVDAMDLIFNNSIINWIQDQYYTSTEVDAINTSMNNYIVVVNTSVTNSITANNQSISNALTNRYTKAEADAQNTSVNNYILDNNDSVNNYVLEVNGTNTVVNAETICAGALYLAGNGTCTADLNTDTDTFVANYSTFLTHISWATASNGTLFLTSQWNATNESYALVSDWNATNSSYRLITNHSFLNGTSYFSGNVGIGTTGPEGKLHVIGATYAAATDQDVLIGDDIQMSSATGWTKVVVGQSDNNSEIVVGQGASNNLVMRWDYDATAADAIASIGTYGGANDIILQEWGGSIGIGSAPGTAGLAVMNGNVGIGTTAPGYKLEVNGSTSGISIYASNNISAEDYLYHSPYPSDAYTNEQALSDLLKIKGKDGKVDHLTMPTNAISILEKPIYNTTIIPTEKTKEVPVTENITIIEENCSYVDVKDDGKYKYICEDIIKTIIQNKQNCYNETKYKFEPATEIKENCSEVIIGQDCLLNNITNITECTNITEIQCYNETIDLGYLNKISYEEQICVNIMKNETYIENVTNQTQIGIEEEPQTSVGMMLGNIIKSIQKLFDINTEQDIRLAKYDSCLASSNTFDEYKLCVEK